MKYRRAILRFLVPVLSCLLVAACDESETPDATLPVENAISFSIDPERITVSGISSGAYMAGQFHVAWSQLVGGAGLLAGGPWDCAQGSITKALGPCVKGGDIELDESAARLEQFSRNGQVDDSANLRDDRVWIFYGAKDATVGSSVTAAAADFYRRYIPESHIAFVDDVDVVHGMPTLSEGQPCDTFAAPFLNACNYDAAGELLQHLYGSLNPPSDVTTELLSLEHHAPDDAALMNEARLYAPAACRDGETCGLHIALHGCAQSEEVVGDAFFKGAGYNRWAETNRLLVLYPQVKSSRLGPMNPLGCWDWWGYTGDDYATKAGPQMAAVRAMIDTLSRDTR